jgi:hypothetical protein
MSPAILRAPHPYSPRDLRRALPFRRDFGTARPIAEASANDVTTIVLQRPLPNQLWLLGTSNGGNSYWYVPGASQDAGRVAEMFFQYHSGSGGWQSVALTSFRAYPIDRYGIAAWPGTFDLNMGSTTAEMCYALLLERVGPFLGRQVRYYAITGASSTSYTYTPPTNPLPRPGGLAVVVTCKDNVGPNSATGIGWTHYFVGRLALSVYYLPLTHIETPPPIVYGSAGVADTWTGVMSYLR